MSVKPFTPEEAREILESLQQPVVFFGMASDWPALDWNVEQLSQILDRKAVRFRIGKRREGKTPLFETQCSYREATVREFLCWAKGQSKAGSGPFCELPLSHHWAYADYKYLALLFEDKPSMFEGVAWSDFGYPGRNGRESTLWIGTAGANTPCHLDSYGCNLVLQVQGRKRWHLFPPEDTGCLYPTRVPYEESSVFSRVSVTRPDLQRFPAFSGARAHTVTLEPGQVLFVPRHWWHYVESLDPLTVSVNSWMELEVDDEARVAEAVTRTVVCALKTTPGADNGDAWLNPTEGVVTSHDENLQYLNLAMRACAEKQGGTPHESPPPPPPPATANARAGKRDAKGQPKRGTGPHPALSAPFGPHLVPVPPSAQRFEERGDPHPESCPSTDSAPEPPRSCDRKAADSPRGGGSQEAGPRGGEHRPISTNDLLECLVHPEVVAMVTKLLLSRQSTHRGFV
ncbi:HSPB1-associated protein 1 homolog [Anguilla anguilla]|uniref:HSPB1-associated protein 1 homolog n=1 Tax=Anguilla anguilla TaxID=7936 RepID=UPI0015B315DD|nr:HSPB1-associated protein 1 homolog [Anguilla anguilla]XP_035264764.1 HSPB1-associated protein 1 homolog [Anguilla anguilla]XP_035264765.1 HSPB1-associated protein 1 homolog [Anguilla anguilla]XP_035264766.1 HSPB1-associated protein 1 homolog [Anguilla anguilla]